MREKNPEHLVSQPLIEVGLFFFPPSNIWPTLNSFQVEWHTNKRIPKVKLSGHYKYLLLRWPEQKGSGERHSNPFISFHQKPLLRFDKLLERSQNLGKYVFELVYYKEDRWTAWWRGTQNKVWKSPKCRSFCPPGVGKSHSLSPCGEGFYEGFITWAWLIQSVGIRRWWLTSKKPSSCPGDQG